MSFDFKNKKILICGMARSGIASARLLRDLGADVTVQDLKDESRLEDEIKLLLGMGAAVYTGKNPDEIVSEQDLIVISPGVPYDLPFVEKAKSLGIPVWGELELAYSQCRAPVCAITGTNGKTTTTALLGEIIRKKYPGAEIVGNIGLPFAQRVAGLTSCDYAVAEVSSFQLETTLRFAPHIAALLNITPDHLNRHKTLENYIAIKERIFANQTAEDFAVLNYDDPHCRATAARVRSRVIFFSRREELRDGVYLKGETLCADISGLIHMTEIISADEMRIFGGHNIENALAAIAMGLCAGVPPELIREALREFRAVEHRIEFVAEINGVEFYNDSKATNTDAAIKSVEAMKRPIVLIAGGSDKGADFGDWIKTFGGRVRNVIVMGEVADKITEACRAYGFGETDRVNSLKDAVDLAYSKAAPGDCVLLSPACASFDMFDNYEQRGKLFKEFVRELEK